MKGIRATEVRNFIRANGEEGVVKCLEQLYERQSAVDQQLQELGLMQLQMIKSMQGMMSVGEAMKNTIESITGGEDDDLPPATG